VAFDVDSRWVRSDAFLSERADTAIMFAEMPEGGVGESDFVLVAVDSRVFLARSVDLEFERDAAEILEADDFGVMAGGGGGGGGGGVLEEAVEIFDSSIDLEACVDFLEYFELDKSARSGAGGGTLAEE
jgi:hypothetical protein